MTIKDQVRAFIVESFLFGDADAMVDDTASLIENEILDSTAVLELVSFIDEQFGISIADAEIIPANLDSVEAIERFVNSKPRTAAA